MAVWPIKFVEGSKPAKKRKTDSKLPKKNYEEARGDHFISCKVNTQGTKKKNRVPEEEERGNSIWKSDRGRDSGGDKWG